LCRSGDNEGSSAHDAAGWRGPSQEVVDILGDQLDHDGVTTVVEGYRRYVDQEPHDIDLNLCPGSMAGEGTSSSRFMPVA
jgi:hypothetical protein